MRRQRIETFYNEHRDRLYTYALGLTGSAATAEDAVHAAISKLMSVPLLPRRLKPYCYRCIRNAAIDDWRKYAARHDGAADHDPISSGAPAQETRHDVEALLQRLADEEREAVVLKTLHGFTFREIASIQGLPLNTVASRHRRALQKLKDFYEEDAHGQT